MIIESNYGDLFGVTSYERFENEQLKECKLNEENIIKTSYGKIIPKYTEPFGVYERLLKNRNSLIFHRNGNLKSVSLDKQTIISTPMGDYPAELVTFYENGQLNRIFPLNGQINGYWTEENEGELAQPFSFEFDFGKFTTKIISLRFFPSGNLKALTLWPGEVIDLKTSIGTIKVRNGLSLYESGELKSIEPSVPTLVNTMVGEYLCYNADALGIHADQNSLMFTKSGEIIGFTTSSHGVIVTDENRTTFKVGPRIVPSYVDISENVIMPITVRIEEEFVVIDNGMKQRFAFLNNSFKSYESKLTLNQGCNNCSSCNACG